MPKVVGVRFKPVTKIYYFDPDSVANLRTEDRVIVETSRGVEMGIIAQPPHEVSASEIKGKLKKVTRRATAVDLVDAVSHQTQEKEALDVISMTGNLKITQDGNRYLISGQGCK